VPTTRIPTAEIMDVVEQLGGYFESSGLTRLAGRLLGWSLICTPDRQSSEELAIILRALAGPVSPLGGSRR
jgi:hypothetical protein